MQAPTSKYKENVKYIPQGFLSDFRIAMEYHTFKYDDIHSS
jgi:hypothetical protein